MLIDWFTVIAQALNFLILVWLMRRYLYQPILKAVDARESLIATKLSDAEAKVAQANAQLDSYNQKTQEFDAQKKAMLTEAADAAKTESQKILVDARSEADKVRDQMADSLDTKFNSLSEDIKRRTCEEVLEISRRVLSDLAAADLEERMVQALDQKLRAMNDTERAALRTGFESGNREAVVKSAFELPANLQGNVQSLLKDVLGFDGATQFQVSPSLVSGIELSAPGAKIAWSIDDYLRSLDEKVGEILGAK